MMTAAVGLMLAQPNGPVVHAVSVGPSSLEEKVELSQTTTNDDSDVNTLTQSGSHSSKSGKSKKSSKLDMRLSKHDSKSSKDSKGSKSSKSSGGKA